MNTPEQIVNGIMRYADREIIPKLDTAGKWVIGSMIGMTGNKINEVATKLSTNPVAKAIGAVNEDGLYDVDKIVENVQNSANKYGNLSLNVPMLGTMTFTQEDVMKIGKYIKGEM
jgi:hypothetical protein